jgi:hypothetical protein
MIYELTNRDGSKRHMNLVNGDIHDELAKLPPDEISELVDIRQVESAPQRERQAIPASSSPVSGPSSTDILIIQQENADLKADMARLREDLERQLAEFPLRLAELISNAKAQEQ